MSRMTGQQSDERPLLTIGGAAVPTMPITEFFAADERRASSFVSNFGDWQLPPDASAALAAPVGHLEWFHDTGELVLIGDVPEAGAVEQDIPAPDTAAEDTQVALGQAADVLAGPWGGAGLVGRSQPGAVRETVYGGVVESDTRVAILAVIEHGPQVHERLWGWHRWHRKDDGWGWLQERLAED